MHATGLNREEEYVARVEKIVRSGRRWNGLEQQSQRGGRRTGTITEVTPGEAFWCRTREERSARGDTLSLLRERRVFTSDPEDKKSLEAETTVTTTTGFVVEHGPKTSEVYDFVGTITTVIATGTFSLCPKHV
ncbi:hypothetical protein KSP40_PGU019855 [Platanthera guangdongensis]|uniref:Uncharacterized protein n=1 Tax=Platanthera guangdongensis TaxID=2320717 RepID=A0ABR2LT50_9ASPA